MNLKRQGDLKGMYEKLQTLPDAVRNHESVALMMVMTSSYFDEAVYKQELENFAKHHTNHRA